MAHNVNICGVDTATLPKLSKDESKSLMLRLKSGDREAKEKFVQANLRLVLSIVQRFGGNKDSDDLFQVGCVGLIKAIENFDVSMDVMFSTYAVPMIIGEIRRFIRDANSLKVSRSLRDIAYKSLAARERMTRDGREPNNMEIAIEIDVPLRKVEEALDAVSEPMSIYDSVYNDDGDNINLVDQLYDKKSNENAWIENVSLKESLRRIPDKERQIISLRYYQGRTQTEISQIVGISQAQVSRLEKYALERLKKYLD